MTEIEFIPVAEVSELPPGERLFLSIGNQPVVVLNIAGELFAIGDVCSHDSNPLDDAPVEGEAIVCPRHGARFDLRSGKALCLPAVDDIPTYPVRVKDGKIELGVPLS